MSAHTGELLSGTPLYFLNLDLAEVGTASPWTTRWQVVWAGRLVRGGTWSLRRGLQRSLVRGRWYRCDGKPFWLFSCCGSGACSWYSFMPFLSTGSRSVFDGCGHLSRYMTWNWSVEIRCVASCVSWSVAVGGCVLLGPHTRSALAPISSHLGFCTA